MDNFNISYRQLWNSLVPLYDKEEAQSIVRIVLEEMFGLSLTDIVCGAMEKLTDEQYRQLSRIMSRLQKGEPVQYVLGYTFFLGRKFHVEHGVLIPRPETEELCQIIIDDFKSSKFKAQSSKLLDIGTGSGCIAITLALEIENSEVSAIDVSPTALNIAKINAMTLHANLNFYHEDILAISTLGNDKEDTTFNCIVSNPPYVTESEKQAMRSNVLDYEPSTALFVPDNDPLRFYRAIADFAKTHLTDNGCLYFEINPLFAVELQSMLQDKGFVKVELLKDGFDKQRFVKCSL